MSQLRQTIDIQANFNSSKSSVPLPHDDSIQSIGHTANISQTLKIADQKHLMEHKSMSANSMNTNDHLIDQNTQSSAMSIDSKNQYSSDSLQHFMELPKMENLVDFFSICCSTAVIFGGIIPYIPQYMKIKNSNSSEGFSTYVCLTLLLANILRIAFWFGHHFELPLLIQSFVMITGMVAMMEICVRVRNTESSYIISSIRVPRSLNSNRRRSTLIGKIMLHFKRSPRRSDRVHSASMNDNLGNGERDSKDDSSDDEQIAGMLSNSAVSESSESTPIYSVSSIAPLHTPLNDSSQDHIQSDDSSYQQQQRGNTDTNCISTIDTLVYSTDVSDNRIEHPQHHAQGIYANYAESHLFRYLSLENGYRKCYFSSSCRCFDGQLSKWLRTQNFWDWDDLFSYIKFLTLFTLILSMVTYLLLDNHIYIESLGFVALFIESMLGLPQLIRNNYKKSTRGMSVEMVILWLSGDLFKTIYYIVRHNPAQFITCGSIQITVDILILIQVFWYRKRSTTYSKLVPKTT